MVKSLVIGWNRTNYNKLEVRDIREYLGIAVQL